MAKGISIYNVEPKLLFDLINQLNQGPAYTICSSILIDGKVELIIEKDTSCKH